MCASQSTFNAQPPRVYPCAAHYLLLYFYCAYCACHSTLLTVLTSTVNCTHFYCLITMNLVKSFRPTHLASLRQSSSLASLRHSSVVHTDGSTFTLQSPLPTLPRIDLVKDTVHHPLFNPRISASELDENSEELLKFRRKFQSVVGDAATSSTKVAAAAAPTSTSTQEDATSTTDLLSELSFDANADGAVIVKKKVQVVAATGKKKKK